jgi:hypothetical protein
MVLAAGVPPALAQRSLCADCHLVTPGAPGASHLADWDLSAHGRAQVGCEKCHGGDATTAESFRAHQAIVSVHNPASPVNRRNLSRTCGACHPGPFVAFQKSRHFEMQTGGDVLAPTCATCHSDVGAHLMPPRALESQCAQCHGEGKSLARPEYPRQARRMLEGVRDVRELLDHARPLIRRVKDAALKASLEGAYQQAEVPLIEAADAGHQFVFTELEERLDVARQRTEALLARFATR